MFYDCEYPRWSLIFILPNAIFFYFLFSEFYDKAYTDKNKKRDDEAKAVTNGKPANGLTQNGTGKPVTNGQPVANGKSKSA